VAGNTTV